MVGNSANIYDYDYKIGYFYGKLHQFQVLSNMFHSQVIQDVEQKWNEIIALLSAFLRQWAATGCPIKSTQDWYTKHKL